MNFPADLPELQRLKALVATLTHERDAWKRQRKWQVYLAVVQGLAARWSWDETPAPRLAEQATRLSRACFLEMERVMLGISTMEQQLRNRVEELPVTKESPHDPARPQPDQGTNGATNAPSGKHQGTDRVTGAAGSAGSAGGGTVTSPAPGSTAGAKKAGS